jgi:hypothetical protein
MSLATAGTSEMPILRRIVDPGQPLLSAEAAQALLRLDFNADDRTHMHQLAAKNRSGNLTPAEEQELNSYIRVGQMLGILQSKARRSLRAVGKSKTH